MEHSYYQDRLSAYHDNELPLQEKVVVEEHLRECSECRELLASYEKLDQLVASHGGLADGEYWEKAARKIDRAISGGQVTETEDITPQKRGYLVWKLLPIAASIVIVGYIGFHRDEIFRSGVGQTQGGPGVVSMKDSGATVPPAPAPVQKDNHALSVPAEREMRSSSKPATTASRETDSRRFEEVGSQAKNEPLRKQESSPSDAGSIAQKPDQPADNGTTDNVAMAQKAVAAPSLAAPEGLEYKKSSSDLATDSATRMAAAADTGLGLAHWVSVRDSLMAVVNNGAKGKSVQALADKIASGYAQAGRTPSSLATSDTKATAVQSLAEASYWVAKLSSDDSVRSGAISTLRDLAAKSSAAEREKIQSYLKALGAN